VGQLSSGRRLAVVLISCAAFFGVAIFSARGCGAPSAVMRRAALAADLRFLRALSALGSSARGTNT